MPTTILETARLRLHEIEAEDAPLVLGVLTTEGFLRHVGDRGVHDLAQAVAYVAEGPKASYSQHGYGLWKVVLKASGEGIGLCGLVRRDSLPAPDLGYAFLPGFEGRGLASEAGAAVLRHGTEVLGLECILAIVSPDNLASVRVLEKLGMRSLGLQRVGDASLLVYGFGDTGTNLA